MAKRSKKRRDGSGDENPYRYLIWAMAMGLWLLLAAALASYSPADPPGHRMAVGPDPATGQVAIQNWIGRFGAIAAHHVYLVLGPGAWIAMLGVAAGLCVKAAGRKLTQPILRALGVVMMSVAASALVGLWQATGEGGVLGVLDGGLVAVFVNGELLGRFAGIGTAVILMVAFWAGAILAADRLMMLASVWLVRRLAAAAHLRLPSPVLVGSLGGGIGKLSSLITRVRVPLRPRLTDLDEVDAVIEPDVEPIEAELVDEDEDEDEPDGDVPVALAGDAPGAYAAQKRFDPEALRAKIKAMPINFAARTKADLSPLEVVHEMDLSGYEFPGLDLLFEAEDNFDEHIERVVRDQAVKLESALREYRIEGEVVGIDSGPVITLYEVRLAPGTKVSQISRIASDLARALRAQNIRIVPNMVGKDTVGIEVPNIKKERVRLKELMALDPEAVQRMRLPMYLGKDASGNALIQDLTTMPHMLLAGTTGSGKSVCMNAIITSFLFARRPDELKLVLIDPKMVELSVFRDIPHLMCPVVTEMSKAAAILEWATTKMDERYELLAEAGVRDIAGYNKLSWEELKERFEPATEAEEARIPRKMPYLVFVVDELADLILTNKEVEGHIVRLAQKARAVGLHLILATQRPQANVVTGLIKGNMPCRVSFKVASGLDSRIVLDQKGAEVLLGQGDMLFLSPHSSKLTRAQGTLVEDTEIRRVVRFLKTKAEQHFEPQLVQIRGQGRMDAVEDEERDPLFDEAVRVVLESRRGSVSLLQRRLTIGYSRASRLIEQMAQAGLIGEYKGSQAREVTISLEEWDAIKAQAEADAAAAAEAEEVDEYQNEEEEQDEEEYEEEEEEEGDDQDVPEEYAGEYRQ